MVGILSLLLAPTTIGLLGGYIVIKLVKESLEKPAPKDQRFDWDLYYKDVNDDNVDCNEILRRREKGYYYTTEPLKPNYTDVVDRKRYEHDIKVYGLEQTEASRKCGRYKYVSYFSGNES